MSKANDADADENNSNDGRGLTAGLPNSFLLNVLIRLFVSNPGCDFRQRYALQVKEQLWTHLLCSSWPNIAPYLSSASLALPVLWRSAS